MDDDEYYRKVHHTYSPRSAQSKVWQGREDEEMLRDKQDGWSSKSDSSTADYSGNSDSSSE